LRQPSSSPKKIALAAPKAWFYIDTIERSGTRQREKERAMARYVECPAEYERSGEEQSLFLAGGITGCIDWQQQMRRLLEPSALVLVNPRRGTYDFGDPAAAEFQIGWEFRHLRQVSAILFWFAAEQIQPISLYELGAWSMSSKPIFVGVDPGYPRRQDVIVQTRLVRPEVQVVDSLEALARQVAASLG
jgi:Nucleoside 2-deoxyribosyltransferase like